MSDPLELIARLHETLNPHELPEILGALARSLGAGGAGAFLLLDSEGEWESDFPRELLVAEDAEWLSAQAKRVKDGPLLLNTAEVPERLRGRLCSDDPESYGDRPTAERGATVLAPLIFRAELVGFWPLFFNTQPLALTALEKTIFLPATSHAASAYVHACLYRDTRDDAAASQSKLRAVNEMRAALQRLDLEGVLAKILDSALRVLSAQVGAIALCRNGAWEPGVELGLSFNSLKRLRLQDGSVLLDTLTNSGARLFSSSDLKGLEEFQLECLLSAPMVTRKGCLGALLVANAGSERSFSNADLNLVETVVGLAATALENALLHQAALEQERMSTQLAVARQVQESLLPKTAPVIADVDLAGKSIPCDETGGDYFDYVDVKEFAGGRLGIVIADVSSHGVGSALVMAATRSFLRALATDESDPRRLLQRVNLLLEHDLQGSHFVTLFFAVVTPPDARGCRKITYASAGHDAPLLFRPNGEMLEMESTGLPLGIMSDANYELGAECELAPGDVLVLTTDGIWETMNAAEECYGRERMAVLVREKMQLSSAAVIDAVLADVAAFRADAHRRDDETIVVLKMLPKSAETAITGSA
jgi:sigma-B regulation protein RsbU (phosphoserine phosphatase)